MQNRTTRKVALWLTIISVVTIFLVNRTYAPINAMGQSQEKPRKWEYCYVSSPFIMGGNGTTSTKVYVSQGSEKWLADSDSTGVAALNRLGAEGWELVSASDELPNNGIPDEHPTMTRFLLKRPR